MGRKLGLSSLFLKLKDTANPRYSSISHPFSSSSSSSSSSWPWPSSCKTPKTSSFRGRAANTIYKTVNSIYFDSAESTRFPHSSLTETESLFSALTEEEEEESSTGYSVEKVVQGARSDRLFFEMAGDKNSIMEEAALKRSVSECYSCGATTAGRRPGGGFKDKSVTVEIESDDPCRDFRQSMEEMVAANGLRSDWEKLEELLLWYLRVNGKDAHGFIVVAFLDMLVALSSPSFSSLPDLLPPPPPPPSIINSFEIGEENHGK